MDTRIVSIWLGVTVAAISARADISSARSFSGQFTACELRGPEWIGRRGDSHRVPIAGGWAFLLNTPPIANPAQEDVALDPPLLVLSCERLKDALLADLALPDQWQSPISVVIRPEWPSDRQPVLTATHDLTTGWSYRLDFPKVLHRQIFVRAVMESLLLELANRHSDGQTAQIPFWLVEGLAAHVQAYSVEGLVLQPSRLTAKVRLQGLDAVRDQLRHNEPLSFQRLSWPAENDLTGDGLQLYRGCAQLFVEKLLQFPDGRADLLRMIDEMPRCLNWQTAFLAGFHSHFGQLLDVEKWWSLSYVEFLTEDIAQPWAPQDCWKKLQDALDVPVQVHFESNAMPAQAAITLQEAIAQWPASEVNAALRRAIGDLQILHYRAPVTQRGLIDLYLETLVAYATGGNPPQQSWIHHVINFSGSAKRNAIAQLDALDKRRYAWHPPN